MSDDTPKILGKFNYLQTKPDVYDVLFIPFNGAAAIIIARNQPRKEMEDMRYYLNNALFPREDDGVESVEGDTTENNDASGDAET